MPGRCPSSVTCGDTLRGEGDVMPLAANTQPRDFNPRPPRGGRRMSAPRPSPGRGRISIHVLREEDDRKAFNAGRIYCEFQSTSSARRTTLCQLTGSHSIGVFQSTSSARRTTSAGTPLQNRVQISIHVLREEDDIAAVSIGDEATLFQSTSSARRSTRYVRFCGRTLTHFNPRPPRGGRPRPPP